MKNILLILIISGAYFFNSCCENCACEAEEVSEFSCAPREVTITEFNAGLTDNVEYLPAGTTDPNEATGVEYEPVDEYSIHSFEFPFSQNSTGSLPNDQRFDSDKGISAIPITRIELEEYGIDLPYYFALLIDKPYNENMFGDILVDFVDVDSNPNNPDAFIRVHGELARINLPFLSESSTQYCEEIKDAKESGVIDVAALRNDMSLYGTNEVGSVTVPYGFDDVADVVVVNSLGQVVLSNDGDGWEINRNVILNDQTNEYINLFDNIETINASAPVALADMLDQINDDALQYVQIEINIGDSFFYRARNGRDFIFSIINIDKRDVGEAIKGRVSIMFNEL